MFVSAPQQVERDVLDELEVNNGRVSLLNLVDSTNVAQHHVEGVVETLLRLDGNLHIVNGEIIDCRYLDSIAEEVDEMLQESGIIQLSDLHKQFGLDSSFLVPQLERRVGESNIIHGLIDKDDRGTIFTSAYIARQTALVRGVLGAITRPTPLPKLVSEHSLDERKIKVIGQGLLKSGRISGVFIGSGNKAQYIPNIQSRVQDLWIERFFKSNHFVDYESARRLGIKAAESYVINKFPDAIRLNTCVVSSMILENVEAEVEESIEGSSWFDIMTVIPSQCTLEDAESALNYLNGFLSEIKFSATLLNDRYIVSKGFILSCQETFSQLMSIKAKQVSATSPKMASVKSLLHDDYLEDDQPQSKKIKGRRGKKGALAHAHDHDTANDRKKDSKRRRGKSGKKLREEEDFEYSSKESPTTSFLSVCEIFDFLKEKYVGCEDDMLESISTLIHQPLTKAYHGVLEEIWQKGKIIAAYFFGP